MSLLDIVHHAASRQNTEMLEIEDLPDVVHGDPERLIQLLFQIHWPHLQRFVYHHNDLAPVPLLSLFSVLPTACPFLQVCEVHVDITSPLGSIRGGPEGEVIPIPAAAAFLSAMPWVQVLCSVELQIGRGCHTWKWYQNFANNCWRVYAASKLRDCELNQGGNARGAEHQPRKRQAVPKPEAAGGRTTPRAICMAYHVLRSRRLHQCIMVMAE